MARVQHAAKVAPEKIIGFYELLNSLTIVFKSTQQAQAVPG